MAQNIITFSFAGGNFQGFTPNTVGASNLVIIGNSSYNAGAIEFRRFNVGTDGDPYIELDTPLNALGINGIVTSIGATFEYASTFYGSSAVSTAGAVRIINANFTGPVSSVDNLSGTASFRQTSIASKSMSFNSGIPNKIRVHVKPNITNYNGPVNILIFNLRLTVTYTPPAGGGSFACII